MAINKVFYNMAPESFFGLRNGRDFVEFGIMHLFELGEKMRQKFGFADLGTVNSLDFKILCSDHSIRHKNLLDFREKKLATLTVVSPMLEHCDNADVNTHTIGLVINKNPNKYFYCTPDQIIIMDSFGDTHPIIQRIHQDFINEFIKKAFPGFDIIITKNPQQTDGSLSCLNWTLANLKVAKENLGRSDIVNLLPKSSDLPSILREQMLFLQYNLDYNQNVYGRQIMEAAATCT